MLKDRLILLRTLGEEAEFRMQKKLRGVVPLGEGVLIPNFCSPMCSNFGEIREK